MDIFGLAAAYTHGILRNHPFVDGNKRIAFLTGYVFLGKNEKDLIASEAEATQMTIDLLRKKLKEAEFSMWIKELC
ncbi:MAG: type II toxin-antitoxin system death-on-curing family toxin [Nitrospirales bacterium]